MTRPAARFALRLFPALAAALFAWFVNGMAFAWEGMCLDTAARVNAREGLPPHMLGSIAITESGRLDPDTKAKVAWPWTVTSGGDGQYFPTKAAAIAEVRRLKAAGVANIDVGCMQINLKYHPDAFASLDAAFDPETNVRYAAKFLKELRAANGSWAEAVRHYHSADDDRSFAYAKRVAKNYHELTGDDAARPVQVAQRTNAKRMSAASRARVAPPPAHVASAEEIEKKRAAARAEAEDWRRRKLEAYLARKAGAVDG
ncbi:Lytic transglycosylase [uncultured Alphaproteobacteria bacterium]|uniref:Lytic transglycosylase n=1 Tax=uncultured Alphaproteobacteria bacterium TaxID=91750 RepID=A0A212IYZ8_9PROT|nr:Lytic transglycosylase [uncultured Alphaproteobacteria bacterium]